MRWQESRRALEDVAYVRDGARGTIAFSDEGVAQALAITPLGRYGQPEEIAKVAVFLASDESAWIIGESIRVSGG